MFHRLISARSFRSDNSMAAENMRGFRMETNQNLLEYRKVDIQYGDRKIIQDFSLQMKQGEILGIVGESGSGKKYGDPGGRWDCLETVEKCQVEKSYIVVRI